MEEFLVKIRETNPNLSLAEHISKSPYCEFVDSVASERIDGIAKIYGEKTLQKLMDKFHFSPEDIERIERTYRFKKKGGQLCFWVNFKIRKKGLSKLEKFMSKQPRISEAYLTKNSVYIRGRASSIGDVDELWKNLYKEMGDLIDPRARTKTYFVFRGLSKNS